MRLLKKFLVILLVLMWAGIQQAAASTPNDIHCATAGGVMGTCAYDPACASQDSSGSCACSSSSTVLTGDDNETKIWNYFISKGLNDAQTAGILGNMEQESGFSPTVMQIGGHSNNPYDAGAEGWGLIQWSGNSEPTGKKFYDLYHASGVKGPVYELATQLDLVWAHMNNHPPVTATFDLNHFKSINDPYNAAVYFGSQIEGFGVQGGRYQDAVTIFNQFKGKGAPAAGSASAASGSGGCGGAQSAYSSPDCQTATGDAKILCEAKKYDPTSYHWDGGHGPAPAWHQACPTIGPSCSEDCSGLVNLAVYDAFGVDLQENTDSERSDTTHWEEVSLKDVQPGDLVQPDPGHVEIIDHVSGNTLHTFGAHDSSPPQANQVGATTWPVASGYTYWHYIGKGS